MPTIYGYKAIIAGNAPDLNDVATAILLGTESKAKERGLISLATFIAMTSIAISPHRMPEGPAYVMKKVPYMALENG